MKGEPIRSRQNPRVRWLRKLVRERPPDLAWVEGVRLCEELRTSPVRVRMVVSSPRAARTERGAAILAELRRRAAEELSLADEVFDYVADTQASQGIGAVIHVPDWGPEERFPAWMTGAPATSVEEFRASGSIFLVLDGVGDPGNVGTLVRSAEHFALGPVLVAGPAADPYGPKALRAAMGSALRWPVVPVRDAAALLLGLRERGVAVIVAEPPGRGARPLSDWDLTRATAVLIGSEAQGVRPELRALCDGAVSIPAEGRVESLNAAVAGSILLYEAFRQQRRALH